MSDAIERAIAGGLRSAIHDHGPITTQLIGSAVKRVVGNLRNVPGFNASWLEISISPGEHIVEILEAKGQSQAQLAFGESGAAAGRPA